MLPLVIKNTDDTLLSYSSSFTGIYSAKTAHQNANSLVISFFIFCHTPTFLSARQTSLIHNEENKKKGG